MVLYGKLLSCATLPSFPRAAYYSHGEGGRKESNNMLRNSRNARSHCEVTYKESVELGTEHG